MAWQELGARYTHLWCVVIQPRTCPTVARAAQSIAARCAPLRLLAALCTLLAVAGEVRAQQHGGSGSPAPLASRASEVSIGVRVEHGNQRRFRQIEPSTGEARTYAARTYGGVGLSLGYSRLVCEGELSWALYADYFRSLFFTSAARRLGAIVDTTAQRMSATAGLSVHPYLGRDPMSVEVLAGIGAMSFDFALPAPRTDDDETMQLATGNYTYASAGIGVRVPCSALTFSVRGAYLLGLHTGAFGSRPAADLPNGFDALAAIEYALLTWLGVSARAGLTLFALHLAPLPERPSDAKAQVRDLYWTFGLATTARF